MSRITLYSAARAVFVGVLLLVARSAWAQDAAGRAPRFDIVDIGALPGASEQLWGGSTALRVNDRREVVGLSHSKDGLQPIIWSERGGLRDLGDPPGGTGAAYAINRHGVVVGTGATATFIWDERGGLRPIAALAAVPGHKTANDINERGQIVGRIAPNEQEGEAYLLDPDEGLRIIGDLPGGRKYAGAYAVNNRSEVVGFGYTEAGPRGYYWSSRTGMVEIAPFPGGAGGSNTADINNHGVVVGSASASDGQLGNHGRAYRWTLEGGMEALEQLPGSTHSTAASVNDHGEIAGYGNGEGVADLVAVFWDRDGTPWNLDEVTGAAEQGWHFQQAFGINDRGDIVGWGTHNGLHRGFLLVNQNPEPGAAGVMVLASVALLRRRRAAA